MGREGHTLALRLANAADAESLAALVNSAYRGDSSRAGWTTEADLLGGQRVDVGRVAEMIATPGNVVLVHERDRTPVACVHLARQADACHLGMLTIQPALQAQGIGRLLLEAAEAWAVERWGSKAMRMHVIAQREELIAWYERRGYGRTGECEPFPYGNQRFGLPRRADLVFEVLTKPLGTYR